MTGPSHRAIIRAERKDDMLICPNCGSNEVQAQAWINANTGELIDEQEGADYWCDSCQEHTGRLCDVDPVTRHCVDCDEVHAKREAR